MISGSKYAIKSISLGFFLVIVMAINGTFVLINYAESIFAKTESDMSPSTSSIIIGVVLLVGSIVAISFIERFGRKVSKKCCLNAFKFADSSRF